MAKYALLVVGILAVVGVFLVFYLATPKVAGAFMAILTQTWWLYLIIIALCFILYFIIKLLFGKKK
jgi:hypothetical protein